MKVYYRCSASRDHDEAAALVAQQLTAGCARNAALGGLMLDTVQRDDLVEHLSRLRGRRQRLFARGQQRGRGWLVDPDLGGRPAGCRRAAHEAFGMRGVDSVEDALPGGEHGRGEGLEASGEVGPLLERLEVGLGEGVVVGDARPRVAPGDAEVGEELRAGLGAHWCSAVLVQRQRAGGDALSSPFSSWHTFRCSFVWIATSSSALH